MILMRAAGERNQPLIYDYSALTSPMKILDEAELRQNAQLLLHLAHSNVEVSRGESAREELLENKAIQSIETIDDASTISHKTNTNISVQLSVPSRYTNFLALAINENEVSAFQQFVHDVCTSDVQCALHIYSIKNYLEGCKRPNNLFGNFVNGLLSSEQMFCYMGNFFSIVPDGFLEILNTRCCYERECSLYISYFRYSGTILCQEPILASGDEHGNIISLNDVNIVSMKPDSRNFIAEGSVILHRNKEGKVYLIEWYYEFVN